MNEKGINIVAEHLAEIWEFCNLTPNKVDFDCLSYAAKHGLPIKDVERAVEKAKIKLRNLHGQKDLKDFLQRNIAWKCLGSCGAEGRGYPIKSCPCCGYSHVEYFVLDNTKEAFYRKRRQREHFRWSETEDNKLMSLWKQGEKPDKIAKRFQRTPFAIEKRIDFLENIDKEEVE